MKRESEREEREIKCKVTQRDKDAERGHGREIMERLRRRVARRAGGWQVGVCVGCVCVCWGGGGVVQGGEGYARGSISDARGVVQWWRRRCGTWVHIRCGGECAAE